MLRFVPDELNTKQMRKNAVKTLPLLRIKKYVMKVFQKMVKP